MADNVIRDSSGAITGIMQGGQVVSIDTIRNQTPAQQSNLPPAASQNVQSPSAPPAQTNVTLTPVTFSHDAGGNVVTKAVVPTVQQPTLTPVTFSHNAEGNVVTKEVAALPTPFVSSVKQEAPTQVKASGVSVTPLSAEGAEAAMSAGLLVKPFVSTVRTADNNQSVKVGGLYGDLSTLKKVDSTVGEGTYTIPSAQKSTIDLGTIPVVNMITPLVSAVGLPTVYEAGDIGKFFNPKTEQTTVIGKTVIIPVVETTKISGGNETITALGLWLNTNKNTINRYDSNEVDKYNANVDLYNEMSKQNPIVTTTIKTGGASNTVTTTETELKGTSAFEQLLDKPVTDLFKSLGSFVDTNNTISADYQSAVAKTNQQGEQSPVISTPVYDAYKTILNVTTPIQQDIVKSFNESPVTGFAGKILEGYVIAEGFGLLGKGFEESKVIATPLLESPGTGGTAARVISATTTPFVENAPKIFGAGYVGYTGYKATSDFTDFNPETVSKKAGEIVAPDALTFVGMGMHGGGSKISDTYTGIKTDFAEYKIKVSEQTPSDIRAGLTSKEGEISIGQYKASEPTFTDYAKYKIQQNLPYETYDYITSGKGLTRDIGNVPRKIGVTVDSARTFVLDTAPEKLYTGIESIKSGVGKAYDVTVPRAIDVMSGERGVTIEKGFSFSDRKTPFVERAYSRYFDAKISIPAAITKASVGAWSSLSNLDIALSQKPDIAVKSLWQERGFSLEWEAAPRFAYTIKGRTQQVLSVGDTEGFGGSSGSAKQTPPSPPSNRITGTKVVGGRTISALSKEPSLQSVSKASRLSTNDIKSASDESLGFANKRVQSFGPPSEKMKPFSSTKGTTQAAGQISIMKEELSMPKSPQQESKAIPVASQASQFFVTQFQQKQERTVTVIEPEFEFATTRESGSKSGVSLMQVSAPKTAYEAALSSVGRSSITSQESEVSQRQKETTLFSDMAKVSDVSRAYDELQDISRRTDEVSITDITPRMDQITDVTPRSDITTIPAIDKIVRTTPYTDQIITPGTGRGLIYPQEGKIPPFTPWLPSPSGGGGAGGVKDPFRKVQREILYIGPRSYGPKRTTKKRKK